MADRMANQMAAFYQFTLFCRRQVALILSLRLDTQNKIGVS